VAGHSGSIQTNKLLVEETYSSQNCWWRNPTQAEIAGEGKIPKQELLAEKTYICTSARIASGENILKPKLLVEET